MAMEAVGALYGEIVAMTMKTDWRATPIRVVILLSIVASSISCALILLTMRWLNGGETPSLVAQEIVHWLTLGFLVFSSLLMIRGLRGSLGGDRMLAWIAVILCFTAMVLFLRLIWISRALMTLAS